MYDQYGYQILQELKSQSEVLGTMSADLESALTMLQKVDTVINLLTLLAVIGFGIMLSYILLKWVKK